MSVATIRNYVNPALEYAYDWNTPGGVPGSSEIGAGMDVARLVSQIMGTGESTAEAPAPAVDPATGRGDPAQPTGSGAGGRARVADPSHQAGRGRYFGSAKTWHRSHTGQRT